jgi:hypothetical protein
MTDPTAEHVKKVREIVDRIGGLVEHCDARVIGAALTEAVACFIAAHQPDVREPVLELFVSTVTRIWPVIAEKMADGKTAQ